jgi:SAM-dependent methyltransferase
VQILREPKMLLSFTQRLARWAVSGVTTHWHDWRRKKERAEINGILARPNPPVYYESEELFEKLQKAFDPLPEYGYDLLSTWERGTKRSVQLIQKAALHELGAKVLEVGCGDGMTGYALGCYGHHVTLWDLEDWRDVRAKGIPFTHVDLCARTAAQVGTFDLVFSYNTFEHLEKPEQALAQVVRMCREGGLIYLEFGPLYAGPWGLHAYRTIHFPYPQFIFSGSFLEHKFVEVGIQDLGKPRETLQPLNQWRLSQYRLLFERSRCDIVSWSLTRQFSYLWIIRRFPLAFTGRGLSFDDVTTQAISVMLRKR